MSLSDVNKTVDVLYRAHCPPNREDLKDRLYMLLANSDTDTYVYNTVADTLGLISAVEQIAASKGSKRDKGIDVLELLAKLCLGAKSRLLSVRGLSPD